MDHHPVAQPVNSAAPGVTLANWRTAQFLRWSFQHSREFRHVRSGIIFSEDYLDPASEIRRLEQCIGWSPGVTDGMSASIYDFLLTSRQGSPHGGPFAYRSCETDVLGWACERAAGARMPELLSDVLWSRLGAEHDADISLDRAGVPVHDGGMSAALRDLARFGQMLADGGWPVNGEQVLPAWWLMDTLTGDPGSGEAFAASPTDTRMPGGMYRNTFWLPYPEAGVLLCLGIHGQLVYVDTAARVVGAKLSSWPVPQDPAMLSATHRAFDAITGHLAASGTRQADQAAGYPGRR